MTHEPPVNVGGSIACRELACGYEGESVLTDICLQIERGTVTALLGPNGSGKSTLLRTLWGALPPLSGTVEIGGVDLKGLNSRTVARFISYVPQEEDEQFDFTVRELVTMGRLARSAGLFDTADDRKAATEAIAAAECDDLAERPVTELSGGEKQRVLIARALAQGAGVLLLDEPTSHLDARHQISAARLVRRQAAEGKAVLIALHDLNLAGEVADQAILLAGKRAVKMAPIEEILLSTDLDQAYGTEFERIKTEGGRLRVHPRFDG